MSLINKVLKDLETRERDGEHAQDRPVLENLRATAGLGGAPRGLWLRWGMVTVGVLFIAGTGIVAIKDYGRIVRQNRPGPARFVPHPAQSVSPVLLGASSLRAQARLKRTEGAHALMHLPPALAAAQVGHRAPAPFVAPARPVERRRVPARASIQPQARITQRPGTVSRRSLPGTPVERATRRYRLAIHALQAGAPGQARGDLRSALSLNPKALRPRLLLAALNVQSGRLQDAHALLIQGVALRPRNLPLAMLLAQVDLREGQPQSAIRVLSAHSTAQGAQNEPFWALLAAAQARAHEDLAAISTYRKALLHFPRAGALWVGLGLSDAAVGHAGAARKAWVHAQACNLPPLLARFVQQQLGAASKVRSAKSGSQG